MQFDRDIDKRAILELSTSDAITGFFADLGYNTDARTEQTPGNLGITAESVLRQINRIELIADQDGLLQVYLFEMKSVTVTGTRGLARSFRNRTGNYLLVLTDDYEQIDFVLIEKYLPQKKSAAKLVGQPHVGVRPRTLTVDRRKPDPVHLRVLRRFTYTESDPFSQYDKLESAYAIADWSEQFFNNRALFSDHYLMNRVPELPEWKQDSKPAYRDLNELYKDVSTRVVNKGESVLHDDLVTPCLNALGFKVEKAGKSKSDKPGPDYNLYTQDKLHPQLSMCLVYPWMRYLDGKDHERDSDRKDENPGQKIVSLLEAEDAPDWAIVTNGKIWRLYSKRTHAKATNYYEIDLEEILSQGGPHAGGPGDAFRYFWLIFRSEAFVLESTRAEGEEKELSFLDRLLTESETYAKELGERLKERVFEQVFPLLADGFIAHIRDRDGFKADLSQEKLDEVFQGTLTLLYRILFLLYAEARDLLPAKEVRGYYEASLRKLTEEIASAAGDLQDESYDRLKKAYYIDDYKLYDRLHNLFKVIDLGDDKVNVPVYNGGLFITDPSDDDSADVRNARFLANTKVPDRYLAQALDLLSRDLDPKRHDLVFVDYKSLGVRQLGSIYEGLLEFKLRVAPGKMAIVKGKKTEEVIPYSEATKKKLRILTVGRGKESKERTYKKGDVYIENDKKERKATGSYYTPDHIVKYIVEHTVGPVLEEKFETMRPKLRGAEKHYRDWHKARAAKIESGLEPEPVEKAELIGKEFADELFDIKVLDPAMGSGHFLVEAVDFITDKALDFLNAFPWNPVIAKLERTRHEILDEMEKQGITVDQNRLTDVNLLKRHVLKRCIYGVDLNPMAVELAKVSLWLDCFTLGAPLSFLDHHMKCGNSLIGVTIEDVDQAITGGGTELGLFSKPMQSLKASLKTMLEIGDLPDVTPAQVRNSRNLYESALAKTQPVKRLLDIYTSRWFGNTPVKSTRKGKTKTKARDIPLEFLNSQDSTAYRDAVDDKALIKAITKLPDEFREMVGNAEQDSDEKRFFHWEMEFPEVFYKPREDAPEHVERMEGAGFDAVIGNPPYGSNFSQLEKEYLDEITPASIYQGDSFAYFTLTSLSNVRIEGFLAFIVPSTIMTQHYYTDLRKYLLNNITLLNVEFFKCIVFEDATVEPCNFVISNRKPKKSHMISIGTVYELNELFNGTKNQIKLSSIIGFVGFRLNHTLSSESLEIWSKCNSSGPKLGDITKIVCGLTPYRKGKGIPPQTQEIVSNRSFDATIKLDETYRQYIMGRDFHKYRWQIEKSRFISYGPWLAEPRYAAPYEDPVKIIIRQTADSIIAHIDDRKYLNLKNVHNVKVIDSEFTCKYILGVLNSKLFSFLHSILVPEANRTFAEVKIVNLEMLPIPDPPYDIKIAIENKVTELLKVLETNPHNKQTYNTIINDIDHLIYQVYGVSGSQIKFISELEKSEYGGVH